MSDLDLAALKAAALAAKGNRLYLDVLQEMLDPAAVLALIERLGKLEAVVEHARELKGISDRPDRALAALEAAP